MKLTVERIIAGYKASELKPITGFFTHIDDNGDNCGCAISAVIVGEGHATLAEWRQIVGCDADKPSLDPFIKEKLGLEYGVLNSFIAGFDSGVSYASDEPARALGIEARQKIFVEKVLENDNGQ